jgi:protein phosphatase
MHIKSYGISDIGKRRQNNEDVFAILDEYGFYALADGMGGHLAGEVAAQMAIDNLCQYISSDEELRLPLSSSSLLSRLLLEDLLFFGHVGDSRIYHFRDCLKQITNDHTCRSEKKRRKITKAIGTSCCLEPEGGIIAPSIGDLFLICSDGLTDHLADFEIEETLKHTSHDLTLLCQQLIGHANSRGGHDNITVLALKII